MYIYRCRLNGTVSHLWDNWLPPPVSYIVLVSGFLESNSKYIICIDVESIYFVLTSGGQAFMSPQQSQGTSKFRIPIVYIFTFLKPVFLLIMLHEDTSEGGDSSPGQARYCFFIIILSFANSPQVLHSQESSKTS